MIMMAAMLAGALIYLRSPGPGSLVEALWISGALMSISVFPLFVAFLREAQRQLDAGDGYVPSVLQHQTGFVAAVIGLVLLNELLMGWTFSTAAGDTLPALSGASGVLPFLVGLVTSRWFLFTMSAEMMLTAILLGDRIQKGLLVDPGPPIGHHGPLPAGATVPGLDHDLELSGERPHDRSLRLPDGVSVPAPGESAMRSRPTWSGCSASTPS